MDPANVSSPAAPRTWAMQPGGERPFPRALPEANGSVVKGQPNHAGRRGPENGHPSTEDPP
jgi:hypothetical protein